MESYKSKSKQNHKNPITAKSTDKVVLLKPKQTIKKEIKEVTKKLSDKWHRLSIDQKIRT